MLNRALGPLFFLVLTQTGSLAEDLSLKLDLLIDGSITNPARSTVRGYLNDPQPVVIELSEKDPGNMIGVAHLWTGSITKSDMVGNLSVEVTIYISRTEATDGKVHWWTQVNYGNQISAGIGGPDLTEYTLMALGAPRDLPQNLVLEPRAILDIH